MTVAQACVSWNNAVLQSYMTSILASLVLRFDVAGCTLQAYPVALPEPSMLGVFVSVYMDDIVVWSSSS